jgi:glycosyltransferase involved in cell wall biosynthesis
MRVTLFRDLAQERWASIDVYADRLANGLSRLAPPDWTFVEGCPGGFDLPMLATPSLYFNRAVLYPIYARMHQAPINHVLDNSYGHLLYFINPLHTVVTSHGGTPQTWRQWNREGPAMRFFDWAFNGALHAARIIIVSEYSKRELIEHYDYDPARVHVVHHGVDDAFRVLTEDARAATRAQYLQSNESGLILHVGHCAARKNVEGLLRSFSVIIRSSERPYRLLQVGGIFAESQQRLIDELDIANHITQVPSMPNRQLVDLYNAADAFAFPSLYEGFGIPLIEAMACGVPVVCSESDLFREVCSDAALFVDSQNAEAFAAALARTLSDKALATTLRARGLDRAQHFSWERCARETLAVYQLLA